ncbi:transglutaminase family protein [Luteolibacter yonseiensis]|uniref:Transglutaminase family protein n=1 Tax=Luteolibacter yonseiensis TaxID=1144680 RepID=A0A934R3I1_9BACT|nr:transglutaminase family protein [Luteolibacter yonseiensis]MBK1815398.1 transglutaminase family protein [Luteolibacter yonseiensis]
MNAESPAPEELDALLRLLDDETPGIRERIAERLALGSGDLSEWLASRPRSLSKKEERILTGLLGPARRRTLTREWLAPSGGAAALQEDWETFEALLRVLSDFLHDGVTLRQPLSDALDLLAEEAADEGVTTANELRVYLFEEKRLTANQVEYHDPRNSDLAWSIAEGRSNPLGLCVIFMLTARRLNLEVEGVNFPGHFMCRIFEDGFPIIVDCFGEGRLHLQASLLESPDLNRAQRQQLRLTADPGTILLRLLNNLDQALAQAARDEDAALIEQLQATLA